MSRHTFRAGFLFAGLGAGARGFDLAEARLGGDHARFANAGGVDFDALACEDYERIASGPATAADLATMTPAELRSAWGETAPDCVFTSPPCKGHSGLLSSETAETEKYQEMNSLVFKGLFLLLETWTTPPGLIVLENVPRVTSRGAKWLMQVRQLLGGYGYVFHEEAHDLRRIGDLGAHRRRYLLVARHPGRVPAYVFRPPLKPGKSCGDILAELPLPETEAAGPMHRLPRLSLLNWIRLALIPPGGDWRDLPGMKARDPEARKRWEQKGEKTDGEVHWFKGKYAVGAFDEPARTVIGGPGNGAGAVADPRLVPGKQQEQVVGDVAGHVALDHAPRRGALGVMDAGEPAATVRGRADVRTGPAAVADERVNWHDGAYGVQEWTEPGATVTSGGHPSTGPRSVGDPRIAYDGATARNADRFNGSPGLMGVGDWNEPLGAVTGAARVSSSNAVAAVADPRVAADNLPNRGESDALPNSLSAEGNGTWGGGRYGVGGWDEAAATVCGESYPSNGSHSVADPRVALCDNPTRHRNKYAVTEWEEPGPTVMGAGRPGSGAPSVADPRIPLGNKGPAFNDILRMGAWDSPAPTVTGATIPTSGAASVGDPRIAIGCTPRETSGAYGVLDPARPAYAVTGHGQIDNGPLAVADSRTRVAGWAEAAPASATAAADPRIAAGAPLPPCYQPMTIAEALRLLDQGVKQLPDGKVPVILSPKDGTWHRPLTDLELAALQGLPATLDGAPLQLAGKSRAKHRERIGNAVPVGAAKAIAESLLTALLAAATGMWVLGSTGIWVRRDDGRPAEDMDAREARREAVG